MADANTLLNIIAQSTSDYLEKSKAAENAGVAGAQESKKVSNTAEAIYNQVSQDMSAIELQRGTAELRAQNAIRSVANAGGVNPDTGAGFLQDRVREIRQKSIDAAALMAKRRQELDVNLITNPLGWIKAQVDWNSTGHALETTARELELASRAAGEMNKAVQETARTTELLKETHTAATIEARSRVAGADALFKAQQAALEGIRQNVQEHNLAAQGSKERLEALYNVNNAQRQEEQYKLGLAHLTLAQDEASRRKTEAAIAQEAKEVGKQVDEITLEYINTSKARLGQPPVDAREVAVILQQIKAGASKELQFHLENGRRIKMNGIGIIGANPAEAQEVLANIPNNLPEIQNQVKQLLNEIANEFDTGSTAEAKKAQKIGDPKTARAKYINERVSQYVAQDFAKINGPGNIFYVGDIGSFLGLKAGVWDPTDGIASLQKLPLSQKLLIPLIQQKIELHDPKLVLGHVLEGIRTGKVTSSEATAGLAEIYRRANEINQADRGLTTFGIIPPKAGKGYNIQIGSFGRTLDMTNPNELGRFLATETGKFAYKNMLEKRNEARRTDPLTGQPYGR